MATINIGNLAFTHKGDYASGTAYVKNDVVYYSTNGNAYIAKQATTGNAPTNATYWNQFAQGSGGIWNAGLSLGSAGQAVKVNAAANALEFGTISSDFVKLATFQQLTSVQEVSIDGFYTSDYDTYYLEVINAGESSSNKIKVYMNESGSKVTSNNMRWLLNYADMTLSNNSASDSYTNSNSDNNIRIGWNKSDMNGGSSTVIIQNPLSTTLKKYIRVHSYSMTGSYAYQIVGGAEYNSTNALSGVTIGGNSTSNTIKFHRATLYGLKH